jgi:hypothetical protein
MAAVPKKISNDKGSKVIGIIASHSFSHGVGTLLL